MNDFINNVTAVDSETVGHWEASNVFKVNPDSDKPPYSILMPSPNANGHIHIGHGLNLNLHDVIARYKRMQGFEVYFPPGLDHGGIATQCTVERKLEEEGQPGRKELGREEFLKRMEEWVGDKADMINTDMRNMGLALSWDDAWYTMDEKRNEVVANVFAELYNNGVLYRDERVVNWCPRCESSLSDMEVMVEAVKGERVTITVPIENSDQTIEVTTTRAENVLAAMAVGIGENDASLSEIVGKRVVLPLVGRAVPIIRVGGLDTHGVGDAVLVCPSHSARDNRLAKLNNIGLNDVFTEDGSVDKSVEQFGGMNFLDARTAVSEALQALGVAKVEKDVDSEQGRCYRCGSLINHRLSKQWYMKTDPLASRAIDIAESGEMEFNEDVWKNQYVDWMKTVESKSVKKQNWKEGVCVSVEMNHDGNKDWVISRQIWWGHQVPVWYCSDCGEMHVQATEPGACKECDSTSLVRDTDVLDMWFSCATWPLAVVEWPKQSKLLENFFPMDMTVIGQDVLLFWITATNMISLSLTDQKAFKYVYTHGLLTDEQGRKMTKSLGNVINVHEVLSEYGIDALRDTMLRVMTGAQDQQMLNVDKANFRSSRNRMIELFSLLDGAIQSDESDHSANVAGFDFETLYKDVSAELDKFNIPEALKRIDEGLDRCLFLQNGKMSRNQAIEFTKMYHPYYPVLTESIWRDRVKGSDGLLAAESWGVSEKSSVSMAG